MRSPLFALGCVILVVNFLGFVGCYVQLAAIATATNEPIVLRTFDPVVPRQNPRPSGTWGGPLPVPPPPLSPDPPANPPPAPPTVHDVQPGDALNFKGPDGRDRTGWVLLSPEGELVVAAQQEGSAI